MMTIMEYVDQRRGRMEGDVVANAPYDKQSSVAKSCGGKWRTILQKCRGRAESAWNSHEFFGLNRAILQEWVENRGTDGNACDCM